MEDIVIVDNLHKTYAKNVMAVDGISFTVKKGEIFGFLGPNGAGKSRSGISLFVALNTKNAETTLSVGLLTTFPLLFLSASVMPIGLLPSWVQQVANVNPFTYIAEAFQSLIINGLVWQKIEYALIAIFIVGVLSLGASILLFRRKVA